MKLEDLHEGTYSREVVVNLLLAERERAATLCEKRAEFYGYEEDSVAIPGVLRELAEEIRSGRKP